MEPVSPDVAGFVEQMGVGHRPPRPVVATSRGAILDDPRVSEALARMIGSRTSLDELAAEVDAEREARVQKAFDASAADGAAGSRPTFDRADFGPILDDIAVADPDHEATKVIETMSYIRSWPKDDDLKDSHVGPRDNWAKYHFAVSAESGIGERGEARLSFYALWENPRSALVHINVTAQLRYIAWVAARADGTGVSAWYFPTAMGRARVSCQLRLLPLAAAGASFVAADYEIVTVEAYGGFTGEHTYIQLTEPTTVAGIGFPVPPHASVLIETSFLTTYDVLGGRVSVTAGTWPEHWQIECPFVIVSYR